MDLITWSMPQLAARCCLAFTMFIFQNAYADRLNIYSDAGSLITGVWQSGGTLEQRGDSTYEGSQHYVFRYNYENWWAGAGFNLDNWGGSTAKDLSAYKYLHFAIQAPDNSATVRLSLQDQGGAIASQQVTSQSGYNRVVLALDKFESINLAAVSEIRVSLSDVESSTGTIRLDDIYLDTQAHSTENIRFWEVPASVDAQSALYLPFVYNAKSEANIRAYVFSPDWQTKGFAQRSVNAGQAWEKFDISLMSDLGKSVNVKLELWNKDFSILLAEALEMNIAVQSDSPEDESGDSGNTGFIPANDRNFQWTGRIDRSQANAPRLHYAYSSMKIRFHGTSLTAQFSDDQWGEGNYMDFYLDGASEPVTMKLGKDSSYWTYEIANNLSDTWHDLEIVKRSPVRGAVTFHGLYLDEGSGTLSPEPKPSRKIEFIGASILSGYAVEYNDRVGQCDPADLDPYKNNAYQSFAARLSRKLNAEGQVFSIPGIGMVDGAGYAMENEGRPGIESKYDRMYPYGTGTLWNFSLFQPRVVVFPMGQNDARALSLPDDKETWKNAFKKTINNLKKEYPADTRYILTTSIMNHDTAWDDAQREVAEEMGSTVSHYRFKRAGKGSCGHPRREESEEMAAELENYINTLDIDW